MDSGVTPTHSKKPAFVIIVLVLLLLGLVYVYGQNKTNTQKKNSSNAEWLDYSATKYGFKFSYPKIWGSPQISTVTDTTGRTYSVSFPNLKTPKVDKTVLATIKFDTNDMTERVCSTDNTNVCGSTKAYTSKDVESILSSKKSKAIKQDGTSFATMTTAPEMNLQSQLDISQIVKLNSINVSAIRGSFSIYGPKKDCPSNRFDTTNSQQCVSEQNFDELNKVLKSFK